MIVCRYSRNESRASQNLEYLANVLASFLSEPEASGRRISMVCEQWDT